MVREVRSLNRVDMSHNTEIYGEFGHVLPVREDWQEAESC